MRPQFAPEFHLIQFRDADAVLVCGDMLRHDVHGHLAEKKVRADACRRRDAGGRKHIKDDLHGQVMGCQLIGV